MQSSDTASGLSPHAGPKRLGGLKFNRCSNAYMLVYVRLSDWPRIMGSVTKNDIAPYLRERLEVRGLG
jgi:ubiquitin carboxyl-terminal hydrolase 7